MYRKSEIIFFLLPVVADAIFIFVPREKVSEIVETKGAIPFDVTGAELGHHGNKCSFEAIVEKYNLADPAIKKLAEIVNGADVSPETYNCPESSGLKAIAEGFALLGLKDDHEILEKEFAVYDALYEYCRKAFLKSP